MLHMNQPQQKTKAVIHPQKEIISGSYRWFTYPADVTGLQLICLEDLTTGTVATTTIANPQKLTPAHRAWPVARQSRSAARQVEILDEITEKGVDPERIL